MEVDILNEIITCSVGSIFTLSIASNLSQTISPLLRNQINQSSNRDNLISKSICTFFSLIYNFTSERCI